MLFKRYSANSRPHNAVAVPRPDMGGLDQGGNLEENSTYIH